MLSIKATKYVRSPLEKDSLKYLDWESKETNLILVRKIPILAPCHMIGTCVDPLDTIAEYKDLRWLQRI